MPTGYTHGVQQGTIKTFKEYATQCIRAFGAAIHMRDDSQDTQYEPQTVGDYHPKNIKEAQKRLEKLKKTTDRQLIVQRKKEIISEIEREKERLNTNQVQQNRYNTMLKEAEQFNPPTPDHVEYKKFMISQLKDSIKFDDSSKYINESINALEKELQNLNADDIRKTKMDSINYDINYHTEELVKEQKRVNEANKWVQDIIEVL